MRVLYGIQGTGNGHLARARSLVPAMRKAGIELDFLLSGRDKADYFNMELFGDFETRRGLTLIIERGRLKMVDTVLKNNVSTFLRDVWQLDLKPYDLVINDFEPISAWAAKLRKVPCIGISHQCAFSYNVPKVKGYLSSRLLMNFFAPVNQEIGLHWHHFNQPVLPPLIEPHTLKGTIADKILVYLAFESIEDIINFLQPFTDYEFQVFAKVKEKQDLGHIKINPLSHTEFHHHLEDCGGVISNAGFELASECLALGKKLLIKPLSKQFEQESNALALQSLNRATVTQTLDQGTVARWLELPPHEPIDYPDVAAALAEWLVQEDRCQVSHLASQLWANLALPYEFNEGFGDELKPNLVV